MCQQHHRALSPIPEERDTVCHRKQVDKRRPVCRQAFQAYQSRALFPYGAGVATYNGSRHKGVSASGKCPGYLRVLLLHGACVHRCPQSQTLGYIYRQRRQDVDSQKTRENRRTQRHTPARHTAGDNAKVYDTPDNACQRGGITGHVEPKVNAYLKEIADLAKIPKHLTSHIGRHTFATMSLNNHVPLETISKMLGHSDITTTQIYAKMLNNTISEDREVMRTKFNSVRLG